MKIIELNQAFQFWCEECGTDNFIAAIWVDPERIQDDDTTETLRELEQAVSEVIEDFEAVHGPIEYGYHWLAAPSEVTCKNCKARFKTREE